MFTCVIRWFFLLLPTIFFEQSLQVLDFKPVVLSEFYGSKDHKLIIFVD